MSMAKRQNERRLLPHSKPWKEANSPPKDGLWMFVSIEMLQSPAWQVAPSEAKLALLRLIEEHHYHAGQENGNLTTTYDQFQRYGIQRRQIKWAINCLTALGFVRVRSNGSASGRWSKSATYELTFRSSINPENLPSNDWKRFKTVADAFLVLPEKPKRVRPEVSDKEFLPVSGVNYRQCEG